VTTLIRGGRVIDPSQDLDGVLDVLVDEGGVVAVAPRLDAPGAVVMEAGGLVVCPGLVDMHVHLREPGREDEETIESGARAAVAGGFTAVACMPNTEPTIEGEEGVRFVQAKARDAGLARVYPIAAVSKGLRGELLAEIGSALRAGAVGVSDDGKAVADSSLMRRALEYTRMFGRPLITHAEDTSLTKGGAMNEGRVSTLLGLGGMPKESEEIAIARDIALARLAAGRLHVAHVTTAGGLGLVRDAKVLGAAVTCEVTPHHFALSDEAVRTYDTNTKVNPPLRSAGDVDAVKHALRMGLVDAIASDHAPHAVEEKDQEFDVAPFGMVGLETSLGLVLTELYHQQVITLAGLVLLMSTNPASILGLASGTLKPGAPADVTIFDPEKAWTVDEKRFHSRSRNTPFSGWQLKGKAVTVIVGGRVLMREGELVGREPGA
jgi:dihydroorotase